MTIPQHVAIIMDGNGRWAEARQLPRLAGHKAGVKAIERTIRGAMARQIKVLTLFAFGIENWQRPQVEVDFLMDLFIKQLGAQVPQFVENKIRLRVMGDRQTIDTSYAQKIAEAEALTASYDQLTVVIAFNYSGRWDLLQATRRLASKAYTHALDPNTLSYQDLEQNLSLSDLPEPDLFIRTSGEQRLSNFLLWQLAYTELYFTEIFWPDFDEMALDKALQAFALRQRRYGLTKQQTDT